jgi:hypothetical protein
MKIVCVYKTGGDFDKDYVIALHNSLKNYGYDFVCLTDAWDVPHYIRQVQLKYNLPGWWSKLELFDRDNWIIGEEDILYFDLDTVILDDISDLIHATKNTNEMIMLKDFYFPKKLASGVMYIPNKVKDIIFNEFINCADQAMIMFKGDQDFIADTIRINSILYTTFPDIIPDYIASYKCHIFKTYPKHITPLEVNIKKSKIICYHGKPRPKDVFSLLEDIYV